MSTREELIEYLDTHCIDSYGELQTWQVADFIISDRKKVVEPLVKYKSWIKCPEKWREWCSSGNSHCHSDSAIDQTLKKAGVEI